jgi:hypothetical protein
MTGWFRRLFRPASHPRPIARDAPHDGMREIDRQFSATILDLRAENMMLRAVLTELVGIFVAENNDRSREAKEFFEHISARLDKAPLSQVPEVNAVLSAMHRHLADLFRTVEEAVRRGTPPPP